MTISKSDESHGVCVYVCMYVYIYIYIYIYIHTHIYIAFCMEKRLAIASYNNLYELLGDLKYLMLVDMKKPGSVADKMWVCSGFLHYFLFFL